MDRDSFFALADLWERAMGGHHLFKLKNLNNPWGVFKKVLRVRIYEVFAK